VPNTGDDPAPVRLDDDFTRSAQHKEDSARERARQAKRQGRPPRRPRRKALTASDWRLPTLVVVIIVAACWNLKVGPFAAKSSSRTLSSAGSSDQPSAAGSPTTSTTIGLARRQFSRGDCVLWDQRPGSDGTRVAKVVGCDEAHLIEITGHYDVTGRTAFPSETEWVEITQNGECGRVAADYLGGEIDPHGRFFARSIGPSPEGWIQGDRELWCGVGARTPDAHNDPEIWDPFQGVVKGQPQALLFDTGACLSTDPATHGIMGTVPCGEPHAYEVTGAVDAGAYFTAPPAPDSGEWGKRLNSACTTTSRTYFSAKVPAGVSVGVMPIDPGSWRTGQRTTICLAARYDSADEPILQTVAFRPAH
jgi:hypothetical protein